MSFVNRDEMARDSDSSSRQPARLEMRWPFHVESHSSIHVLKKYIEYGTGRRNAYDVFFRANFFERSTTERTTSPPSHLLHQIDHLWRLVLLLLHCIE